MHIIHHHRPLAFTTPDRLATATAERNGWTVVSIDYAAAQHTILGRSDSWVTITYRLEA